jgi:hypothetical protein
MKLAYWKEHIPNKDYPRRLREEMLSRNPKLDE